MSNKAKWFLSGMAWLLVAVGSAAAQEFPDENRKDLVNALGGPFVIFRDKAIEELKISDEQKSKLFMHFAQQVMETGPFFESLENEKPEDREKKMAEHRQKAHEKLAAFLKETLQPEQLKRFRQINIRYEGLFGLSEADRAQIVQELRITEDQQKKITAQAQETHRLIQKAVSAGEPQEATKTARKVRRDQNAKVESLLDGAQKKQWQEILGKPFELDD